MIARLIQSFMQLLPLLIKSISWDGDTLTIHGDDWSFTTLSAWRISNNGSVEFACWDKEIDELLAALENLSIVEIRHQGSEVQVDPVFQLSDGRILEVFSSDTVEPWVVQHPNGDVFVGGR